MPTVSVIIPSYNHEPYIRECIQSVLDQTYQDFEIVITDDGSSDGSVDAIKTFSDPRIRLFVHQQNQGACVASNNCIRQSTGKYIAMLSSDDAWMPNKLEAQVGYLEQHPQIGAVFGKVLWIDAAGQPITSPDFPYQHVFDVDNRDRFEWLRHFFFKGNCLCHPCSLIHRECYDAVGWLDPAMASIPDFDLWVRLCLKYDIHILDEKLIRFRRIGEDSNASGSNTKSKARNRFENKRVLDHYLKLQDPRDFLRVFPQAEKYGAVSPELIPYFLGRTAIDNGIDFFVLWGLDLIFDLLQNDQLAQALEKQCGFAYRDFIRLTGESNLYNLALMQDYSDENLFYKEQLAMARAQVEPLKVQVAEIHASNSWRLISKFQALRHWLLPYGSLRAALAAKVFRWFSRGRR